MVLDRGISSALFFSFCAMTTLKISIALMGTSSMLAAATFGGGLGTAATGGVMATLPQG